MSNYETLKSMGGKRHAKMSKADKNIELYKKQILAHLSERFPMSLRVLFKSYNTSLVTLERALDRWRYPGLLYRFYLNRDDAILKTRRDKQARAQAENVNTLAEIIGLLDSKKINTFESICHDLGVESRTIRRVADLMGENDKLKASVRANQRRRCAYLSANNLWPHVHNPVKEHKKPNHLLTAKWV